MCLVSPEDGGEVGERNPEVGTPVGGPTDGDCPAQHEVAVPPDCQEVQERQLSHCSEISDKVTSSVGQGQLVAALWEHQVRSPSHFYKRFPVLNLLCGDLNLA